MVTEGGAQRGKGGACSGQGASLLRGCLLPGLKGEKVAVRGVESWEAQDQAGMEMACVKDQRRRPVWQEYGKGRSTGGDEAA